MKDIDRITLADMMMDIFSGYVQGYIRIYYDMLGYLNGISFLGYDFQSYPNSQKISHHILTYPFISYHIPTYSKISSGANSQMSAACDDPPFKSQLRSTLSGLLQLAIQTAGGPPIQPTPTETGILSTEWRPPPLRRRHSESD
jgi:hypothetical protein